MADSVGFPLTKYREQRGDHDILAEFPEAARRGFPADARELAAIIKKEIRAIESA